MPLRWHHLHRRRGQSSGGCIRATPTCRCRIWWGRSRGSPQPGSDDGKTPSTTSLNETPSLAPSSSRTTLASVGSSTALAPGTKKTKTSIETIISHLEGALSCVESNTLYTPPPGSAMESIKYVEKPCDLNGTRLHPESPKTFLDQLARPQRTVRSRLRPFRRLCRRLLPRRYEYGACQWQRVYRLHLDRPRC